MLWLITFIPRLFVAASSPLLDLYFELLFIPTSLRAICNVFVLSVVSEHLAKFGYGMGIGPAGGDGGERQTSGIAPIELVSSALAETSRPLAKTSPISVPRSTRSERLQPRARRRRSRNGAARSVRAHSLCVRRVSPARAPAGRSPRRSRPDTRSGARARTAEPSGATRASRA